MLRNSVLPEQLHNRIIISRHHTVNYFFCAGERVCRAGNDVENDVLAHSETHVESLNQQLIHIIFVCVEGEFSGVVNNFLPDLGNGDVFEMGMIFERA